MAIVPLRPYQSLTTIVFIDGSLPDLQTILTGLDPSVTAIVLDPAQDGIQQMAEALAGMSGLDSIHIISHGSSGQINLGAAQLSQDTLAQYRTQLATIGNALSATGDLLLYGCNVAEGVHGQAFISALSAATSADVAASTDITGANFLGGNWVLETDVRAHADIEPGGHAVASKRFLHPLGVPTQFLVSRTAWANDEAVCTPYKKLEVHGYPYLEREDIMQALRYAAWRSEEREVTLASL